MSLIELPNGQWINPNLIERIQTNPVQVYNPVTEKWDLPKCDIWLSGHVYEIEGISADDLAKRINKHLQR